jgi:hypothetical protein
VLLIGTVKRKQRKVQTFERKKQKLLSKSGRKFVDVELLAINQKIMSKGGAPCDC